MNWRTHIFVAAGLLVATSAQAGLPRESDPGVRRFLANRLEQALPLLERAAARDADDPDAHAWLADCLRRLGRYDDAEAAARRALVLAPDHAFAHVVLGDTYNPQFGGWPAANADSSAWHIRRAVACDPAAVCVWPSAWSEARRSEDADFERQVLHGMVTTGFLAPALLAYTRWVLRSLPEGAVYLCNGDMDTYPALALPATEGLRPDVTVVCLPMLELPGYRRQMARERALPATVSGDALDSMVVRAGPDGAVVTAGQQVLGRWLGAIAAGSFARPLAVAISVPDANAAGTEGRRSLAGPFWLVQPAAVEAETDTASVRASFANLDVQAVRGHCFSPLDRSPIRRTYTDRMHDNVAAVAAHYVAAVAKSADPVRTRVALDWAVRLARAAGASDACVRAVREAALAK
jgi:hypothetical protein